MRIAAAMSGGVDSSLAAALLAEQGHEVVGLFMQMVDPRDCGTLAPSDPTDAQRVADLLGIRLVVLDFRRELEALIAYFCSQYDAGRTPNPCVLCNKWVKFGRLFAHARIWGAERLATGHYARISRARGRWLLRRGRDRAKDQSYMLFGLEQAQLATALFPLGGMRKEDARRMAKKRGLPVYRRKESQDVCFVPQGNHQALLRERLRGRVQPGPILDTAGNVLGQHPGCQCFTIGQRRGLRVAAGEPRYVVRIDREANAVVVGTREELRRGSIRVSEVNWVAFEAPPPSFRAGVQIRYNQEPVPARIEPLGGGQARVDFDTPVAGVPPGQAAVFYDGELVLGGGWIGPEP
ncbi:MAG: tRNA 2-thiouridine(34) synthase MnmA [Candidatus Brocadiia bacterium]